MPYRDFLLSYACVAAADASGARCWGLGGVYCLGIQGDLQGASGRSG